MLHGQKKAARCRAAFFSGWAGRARPPGYASLAAYECQTDIQRARTLGAQEGVFRHSGGDIMKCAVVVGRRLVGVDLQLDRLGVFPVPFW